MTFADKIIEQIHRLDGEIFQVKCELRLPIESVRRRRLYKRLARATREVLTLGEMLKAEKVEV